MQTTQYFDVKNQMTWGKKKPECLYFLPHLAAVGDYLSIKLLINKLMNRSATCHSDSLDQPDRSIIHKREEHVADSSWSFQYHHGIMHGGGGREKVM